MRFLSQINIKDDYSKILYLWMISVTTLFFHGKIPFVLQLSVLSSIFNLFLIWRVYNFKLKTLLNSSKEFIKRTFLFLLLVSIYIFVFLIDKNNYEIVIKEAIYGLYVLFLLFEIYLVKHYINYKKLTKSFVLVYLLFLAILMLGLYYSLLIKGIWGGKVFNIEVDYNFLSLTLLLGFLMLFLPIFKNNNKRIFLLLSVFAFLITLQILFSGSRRGIVILLIMNVGILLYQIILRKINVRNKTLRYYYTIILGTLVISILAFQFSGKAIKVKFVDYLFQNESEIVKRRITSIYSRYGTILNDNQNNYSNTYKKLWTLERFPETNFIDDLYAKKIRKELILKYEEKEYGEAWNYICELAYFRSYDQFISSLPAIYKDIVPENLFHSSSFDKIPYFISVPFIEENFLSIHGLENLYLIDYPDKTENSNTFKLINKNEGYGFFIALLPDVINSRYQIPISLKGASKENVKIELLNGDNIVLNDVELKISKKDNGFEEYLIVYNNIEKGSLKLKFSVNLENTDSLTIIDPKIYRSPNLESNGKNNISKIDDFYLNRKQNRNRYHLFHYNSYINSDIVKLSIDEEEQLDFFINNYYNYFKPVFKNYGRFSVKNEKQSNSSSYSFYSPESDIHSRAYCVLTAVPGIIYNVQLSVKSSQRPDVKIKRYPETSGTYLVDSLISKNIVEENGIYFVDFSYKVIKSSSSYAAFIVGVNNAEKGKGFSISDVTVKTKKTKEKVDLSKYNYNRLKPKIISTYKRSILENIVIKNEKINLIKQNLREEEKGFVNSRWLRWKVAYYLFEEASSWQKFFGNGFQYLKIYNNVFSPEEDAYDYPHNPIISSILYSGILGCIVYVIFLIISILKYWRQKEFLSLFAILYIISFAFTFFSGNSHFSVPAFVFLSLLPFIFDFKQEEKKSIPKIK